MPEYKTDADDWRRRPRKDPDQKRDCSIYLRLCQHEKTDIMVLAKLAGMPVGEYIICVVLRKTQRVPGTGKKVKKVKRRVKKKKKAVKKVKRAKAKKK